MLDYRNVKIPFDPNKEQLYSLKHLLSLEINTDYSNAQLTFPTMIHSSMQMKIPPPDYKDKSTLILDIKEIFNLPMHLNRIFPSDCDLIIIINKSETAQRIDEYKFIFRKKTKEDFLVSEDYMAKTKAIKEVRIDRHTIRFLELSYNGVSCIIKDSKTMDKPLTLSFRCDLCGENITIDEWNYLNDMKEIFDEHLFNNHKDW